MQSAENVFGMALKEYGEYDYDSKSPTPKETKQKPPLFEFKSKIKYWKRENCLC